MVMKSLAKVTASTISLVLTDVNVLLTLSLPESNFKSINVAVPFKSVYKTLVCDHSIESY